MIKCKATVTSEIKLKEEQLQMGYRGAFFLIIS